MSGMKLRLKSVVRTGPGGGIVPRTAQVRLTGPVSRNAGQPIPYALTRTLNGKTPKAFTLSFRETDLPGAFTDSLDQILIDAAASDPTNVTKLPGPVLSFGVGFVGPLAIVHHTAAGTGFGDRVSSLGIFNPSAGISIIAPADVLVPILDSAITLSPPAFVTPPSIQGPPVVGQILSRIPPQVTGSQPIADTWEWQLDEATIPGLQNWFGDGGSRPIYEDAITYPSAINVPVTSRLWLVYDEAQPGTSHHAKCRVYDYGAGDWVAPAATVFTGTTASDDHGTPAIAGPDAFGYYWVFGGVHNGPIKTSVTTSPGDPTAWTARTAPSIDGSYPKPLIFGNKLYLFYRRTGGGAGGMTAAYSRGTITAGGNISWDFQDRVMLDCPTSRRHYFTFHFVLGTKVYFAGSLRDTTTTGIGYENYVWYFDTADETVHNAANTFSQSVASSPVSVANVQAQLRVAGPSSPGVSGAYWSAGLIFDHLGVLHHFYRATTGAVVTRTLSGPGAAWSAQSSAPDVSCLHKLADGRLRCVDGFAFLTRSLAGVWGGAGPDFFRQERVPPNSGFFNKSLVYGGTVDSAILWWTEMTGTVVSNSTNIINGALRGYAYGDTQGILADGSTRDDAQYGPLKASEISHGVTILETLTNSEGTVQRRSDVAVVIAASGNEAPVCTQVTPIQGSNPPQVGSLVSWAPFSWTASPPGNITPTVEANGVTIPGADPNGYIVQAGDLTKTLRRAEINNNGVGSPVKAVSANSGAVIAAQGGTLTDVQPSTFFVPWAKDTPLTGTDIADWIKTPAGATISSVAFQNGGDAGGRLAATTAKLRCGTVATNFGSTDDPAGLRVFHDMEMSGSFLFNGTLPKTFTFKPLFPDPRPTGGAGGTTIIVNDLATLRAELQNPTTAPRIIRFNTAVNAILATGGNTYTAVINGKENYTVVGHLRVIFGKDGGFNFLRTKNFRFVNMAIRAGAAPAGINRENRDNAELRYVENGSFEYCDFSMALDETFSAVRVSSSQPGFPQGYPFPKRILVYRCGFYSPTYFSGHDWTENSHPYGLLWFEGTQQAWLIQCALLGHTQRNPMTETQGSSLTQNCLIAGYGNSGGTGGIGFASFQSSVENNNKCMSIARGNLLQPPVTTAADIQKNKDRGLTFSRMGSGGKVYIEPPTSDYANHFITGGGGGGIAADPVDGARVTLLNGSTIASLTTDQPFEITGFPPLPTKTQANRDFIRNLLVGQTQNVIGVRTFGGGSGDPLTDAPDPGWLAMSKMGHDAISNYATTGGFQFLTGGYITHPPTGPKAAGPGGVPPAVPALPGTYVASEDTTKDAYTTAVPP